MKANAGSSLEGAERETQMAESEGLCKDRELDVAARYSDDPMSREEFQRMMADATSENPRSTTSWSGSSDISLGASMNPS